MNRPSLRDVIRRKLEAGDLPMSAPMEMEASPGSGATCDGCGVPILSTQIEHALLFVNRVFRLHFDCAAEWAALRRQRGFESS
jgi:hypothetical protein